MPESSVSAKLTIENSPGFLDVELLPRLLPKTTGRRLVQERLYITTPREHSFVPGDYRRRVIPISSCLSSSGDISAALARVGNIAVPLGKLPYVISTRCTGGSIAAKHENYLNRPEAPALVDFKRCFVSQNLPAMQVNRRRPHVKVSLLPGGLPGNRVANKIGDNVRLARYHLAPVTLSNA